MSDKDTETQSYPMERLTSEAPPPYSEVVGHSPTVNKDPASERNEQAPPYQHPALQQYISLPPVRLVSNNLMPPPRRVIVTPPPTRVVVVTPPQPSAPTTVPRRRPELYTRGDTQLSQNQVQDQVNFKLCCTVFCSILLFFLATPLSLLVTLPSLYCVCKAKYDVKRGKVSRAHQESVIGCRVISITVVLTIIAFVVIPIVTLIVIS